MGSVASEQICRTCRYNIRECYIMYVYICVCTSLQLQKRNEKGETLLHVASIEGNLPLIKRLLKEV